MLMDLDASMRLTLPPPITVLAIDTGAPRMLVGYDRRARVMQIIDV
jgi:hypothetical protein